jgi:hypothetical protein
MELVNLLYTGTRKRDQHPANKLLECGFSIELIKEFGSDLKQSSLPSIDAFLEHRPKFREVGKAAIAAMLLPIEQKYPHGMPGDNAWYDYLIRAVGDMRSVGKRNFLSILTFNYDRSLDQFLYMHFRKAYGMDNEAAAQHSSMIPISHLYGQLGELPHKNSDSGLPYGTDVSKKTILKAVRNIKVLYEDASSSVEFQRALDMLRDVEIICFLGLVIMQIMWPDFRLIRWQAERPYSVVVLGLPRTKGSPFCGCSDGG